jgi:hypothetical protein
MSIVTPRLALEVTWFDDDMLELTLLARSATFSGQANFYAALDEPSKFADFIEGFPRDTDDRREYEFGSTMPGHGGARVWLFCRDRTGHLSIRVSVYMNPAEVGCAAESATVQLGTVPAAIDTFVEELRKMRVQVGEVAVLCDAT